MTNQSRGILIACIAVFLALVTYKVTTWVWFWRATYVVGTFQGTLSFDKSRVRIAPDKTGMFVARVEGHDGPAWIRSFSGLSPGRAAQHVVLPDSSVAVIGVFDGELRSLEMPGHPLLRTEDKQGVFAMQIRPDGNIIAQRLLASGEEFKTPVIKLRHDQIIVDVRYSGRVNVEGKAASDGIHSPALHLELSPSGEILRWEANGSKSGGAERGAPAVRKLELMDPAQPTCEVCRLDTPTEDPNCEPALTDVCDVQGDSYCCLTEWDRWCEGEGAIAGRDHHVPGVVCTCAHSLGTTGELLPAVCSSAWTCPAGCNSNCPPCTANCPSDCNPSCVERVDDLYWYCSTEGWNAECVSDAATMCPH